MEVAGSSQGCGTRTANVIAMGNDWYAFELFDVTKPSDSTEPSSEGGTTQASQESTPQKSTESGVVQRNSAPTSDGTQPAEETPEELSSTSAPLDSALPVTSRELPGSSDRDTVSSVVVFLVLAGVILLAGSAWVIWKRKANSKSHLSPLS